MKDRRKKVWVHKAKSFEDAEKWDAWFWQRAGAAARFEAAWTMVGDFLKMRGKSRDQLRLRRSIQHVERAWNHRRRSRYGKTPIDVLGLNELIQAKKATARPQDTLDLTKLLKKSGQARR